MSRATTTISCTGVLPFIADLKVCASRERSCELRWKAGGPPRTGQWTASTPKHENYRTTALAPMGERVTAEGGRVRGWTRLFSKQRAAEPRFFTAAPTPSRWPLVFAALFAIALCPLRAEAHLNSTGLGPVYDGLAHFLLSPEDLVPVLALALFAGLRGVAHGRRALFVLPAAWLLGGFLGMAAPTNRGTALTAISFLFLGGLLAADARLSLRATTVLAALVGLFHGYLNGAGMGLPGVGTVALLGLVFAVFVLVAVAAASVVRLRWPWTRIAVRVVGSWIAASGLLMVGWAMRRG